ncbi:hypothetical protein VB716_06685 [Synechococcus sp. CCY9201]|uniref:hypothetical protein n=1 Tax=Synechococcus sp. CCY9201 TaxID=174697 RepID=UPI002B1FD689|nr:hypothetical protein [Synechococcus sp. CCY9201]MEA5473906.1 hypothetical protein [Synechococcus sp. CCY9201]
MTSLLQRLPRSAGLLPLQRHQLATDVLASPGILAYRFEANLFYANANRFTQELMAITSHRMP